MHKALNVEMSTYTLFSWVGTVT